MLFRSFIEGLPEHYVLPLCLVSGTMADQLITDAPQKVLARLSQDTIVYDAAQMADFQKALFLGLTGEVTFHQPFTMDLAKPLSAAPEEVRKAAANARVLSGEQSNTSISYADTWLVKFFRKFETGAHPEVEMTEHLTQHAFNVPPFLSALNLHTGEKSGVLAMLTLYTAHQGDGWLFTMDELARLFDQVLDARTTHVEPNKEEVIGITYPDRASQLGRITAQMHAALAQPSTNPSFSPLPFTGYYGRSLYQGMRANATRVLRELRRQMPSLSDAAQAMATTVIDGSSSILQAYEKLLHVNIRSSLIRVHGDYHLGQVLNTGQDFVVIDFEGEPRLSLSERRLRRPALRDVAGMVRSFDYAAASALEKVSPEDRETLAPWAEVWEETVIQGFLDAYFAEAKDANFIPDDPASARLLLDLHILDKALYEIGYELSYRPHLVTIPLSAVVKQLNAFIA